MINWKNGADKCPSNVCGSFSNTAAITKSRREQMRSLKNCNFSVKDKPRSGPSEKIDGKDIEVSLNKNPRKTQEDL